MKYFFLAAVFQVAVAVMPIVRHVTLRLVKTGAGELGAEAACVRPSGRIKLTVNDNFILIESQKLGIPRIR